MVLILGSIFTLPSSNILTSVSDILGSDISSSLDGTSIITCSEDTPARRAISSSTERRVLMSPIASTLFHCSWSRATVGTAYAFLKRRLYLIRVAISWK